MLNKKTRMILITIYMILLIFILVFGKTMPSKNYITGDMIRELRTLTYLDIISTHNNTVAFISRGSSTLTINTTGNIVLTCDKKQISFKDYMKINIVCNYGTIRSDRTIHKMIISFGHDKFEIGR